MSEAYPFAVPRLSFTGEWRVEGRPGAWKVVDLGSEVVVLACRLAGGDPSHPDRCLEPYFVRTRYVAVLDLARHGPRFYEIPFKTHVESWRGPTGIVFNRTVTESARDYPQWMRATTPTFQQQQYERMSAQWAAQQSGTWTGLVWLEGPPRPPSSGQTSTDLVAQYQALGDPPGYWQAYHESAGETFFSETLESVVGIFESVGREIARIPENIVHLPDTIVDYIRSPREFLEQVARAVDAGGGFVATALLGPAVVPLLLAAKAGASAHTPLGFATNLGRDVSGGMAVGLALSAVGAGSAHFFESMQEDFIVQAGQVAVIFPRHSVDTVATIATYVDGFIPFLPAAIGELAIQAQYTRDERDRLRIRLAELRADIAASGGTWLPMVKQAFKFAYGLVMSLATAGLAVPALLVDLATEVASAAEAALKLLDATETTKILEREARDRAAAREAELQSEIARMRAAIAQLEAEIAALGVVPATASMAPVVPASQAGATASAVPKKYLIAGATVLILIALLARRS